MDRGPIVASVSGFAAEEERDLTYPFCRSSVGPNDAPTDGDSVLSIGLLSLTEYRGGKEEGQIGQGERSDKISNNQSFDGDEEKPEAGAHASLVAEGGSLYARSVSGSQDSSTMPRKAPKKAPCQSFHTRPLFGGISARRLVPAVERGLAARHP
jgi:hypothetical protein